MSKEELSKRVAYLEFANDQLTSELKYVDGLLRSIGFPDGLNTVKRAAQDIQAQELTEPDFSDG